ncbi:ApeI family dehydratase [Flavitalea flava]
MLLNDFFTIISVRGEPGSPGTVNNSFNVKLEFNPRHKVFDGHFPGRPVVPGACLLQMVKEITETLTGKEWNLTLAEQLKFMVPIDPNENRVGEMRLTLLVKEEGLLGVSANLLIRDSICFKFSGRFQVSRPSPPA